MPKRMDIHKILVIGSGPIVIGQAAEFDYSGSQACLSLREEGYQVVLINSNPATIMTDKEIANQVYIEPITLEFVSKIIRKEIPDAILPTLGGQTGLNMAKQLADSGILDELGIELLGTKLDAIEEAEDREKFKDLMKQLHEPVPESQIATNYDEAKAFVEKIGFPVVIRPAYTLGGSGGGFVDNYHDLKKIVTLGLGLSPVTQVLVEHSIAGYKEIEFEVMRDANDNAMIVCSMENVDPVGIHTGDSIVVSPTQTLSDQDYQMMRDAALKIIRALKIEGGCNVQMAIDQYSGQYYIIEVNPRVSRSSALASKATGYPIAKMSAKIAVGLHLDEIINPITGKTLAEFEPALDYVVTKIPRWPFDKFTTADRTLGTQMKATGEVMAIGRNFEESFLKAVRSLEVDTKYVFKPQFQKLSTDELLKQLMPAQNDRLFVILELLRRHVSVNQIHDITQMNQFYLYKFQHIIEIEEQLKQNHGAKALKIAKQNGFIDDVIGKLWRKTPDQIRQIRTKQHITPVYKMVDTAAGEFESTTPYYYSTYEESDESKVTKKPSIVIVGSGPIRIGQGVEFDYATVHCVDAVQKAGYEAIIINSNPETVSTDFSISDKLYFEPLTTEDVLNVIDHEQPKGVILQFGGQTAVNLAEPLSKRGVKVIGTSVEDINRGEDRKLFDQIVKKLSLQQPKGKTATNTKNALTIANQIGYPVLIRPSYVIGGKAMEIVHSDDELQNYMQKAVNASNDHPVLIDSYLMGMESEVDVISDGHSVVIPGILEHIERSGVHSGDSMAVYPPQHMKESIQQKIVKISIELAHQLHTIGLMNIQFIVYHDQVYIIEVNPRASRTVPFISKVTGVPMVQLATHAMLGKPLEKMGYHTGLVTPAKKIAVKSPVFSFSKLPLVNATLGPEMKSTGEVLGTDNSYDKALYKAFVAAGFNVPKEGSIFFKVKPSDLDESLKLAREFKSIGFQIQADQSTADFMKQQGLQVAVKDPVNEIKHDELQVVVNTTDEYDLHTQKGQTTLNDVALEHQIPLFTAIDTVKAYETAIAGLSFSIDPM
ncbi:carbamoyl-phosphate synthase large chain [Philodulcilactobacillus myokoensis]|uniref:Carbamoyl phosphate synthase large chain n=1 Tax=Philodulcilactobacillus myokoensis TaxID=2929573 RepID=A0A9W6B3A8_9LACO|nr:carbamoyl-phosphate synthase large subunit [Philodulcilactobacillus myokoensis]GLB47428.1 carbamoyl-phosphate synthase large chain [Philodulcilactobacillus myokoensis]